MRTKLVLLALFLLFMVLAGAFSLYRRGSEKTDSSYLASFPASSLSYSTNPVDEYSELAKSLIEGLKEGDHQKTSALYNDKMKEVVTSEKEDAAWIALSSQYGQFKKISGYARIDDPAFHFVFVKSDFEKATITFRVIFGEDKRIAGFFIDSVA